MAIHNTDIPVNQVEMTTVKRLKWLFKSNHQERLVQYFFQHCEFSIYMLQHFSTMCIWSMLFQTSGSYKDFRDRRLLLKKVLNQTFLVVRFKLSVA
jgi:hypothetical protein